MRDPGRIAIVGAGPAGLAAAHRLASHGIRSTILEAGKEIGGLARTLELWGRRVDVGPHTFAGGDREAVALWNSLAGEDASRLAVRRGIVIGRKILPYPPRALDVFATFPATRWPRIVGGAAAARFARRDGANAERWIVGEIGRPLYDAIVRGYLEKLWGRPATVIDATFAKGLFGVTGSVSPNERATEPAASTFLYPSGGAGGAWKQLAERGREFATIELESPVEAIHLENDSVRGVRVRGVDREIDQVISTMPLARLVATLPRTPNEVRAAVGELETRNYIIVHLLVENAARLPYLWLYAGDSSIRVGRVSDRRSWFPADTTRDTIVTMEYWCGDDDLWRMDDASLVALASSELRKLRIFGNVEVRDGRVMRLRSALPVPTIGYDEKLDVVRAYVSGIRGLRVIGRHGSFAASSMAEVMGEGMAAADALIGGSEQAPHPLDRPVRRESARE